MENATCEGGVFALAVIPDLFCNCDAAGSLDEAQRNPG